MLRRIPALCCGIALLLATAGWPQEVPPRSVSGLALEVPDDALDAGRIFHLLPGEDTQITVTSSAPLHRLVLESDRLVGWIAVPFEPSEEEAPILAGAFRLATRSLRSGILGRDRELHSAPFLDAAEHPEILFHLTGTREVTRLPSEGETLRYRLTLLGALGVKGSFIDVEVPVEARFFPDSPRTMYRAPGDLVILEGGFDVRPREHGWTPPAPSYDDLVAQSLRIELFLLLTEISPDSTINPRLTQKGYREIVRFQTELADLQELSTAYSRGRAAVTELWDDAEALYRFAALTLLAGTAPPCVFFCQPPLVSNIPPTLDTSFARTAAERANELTHGTHPLVLDTLARIRFLMGDLEEAVALQEKAAAVDSPPDQKRRLEQGLAAYRALLSVASAEP